MNQREAIIKAALVASRTRTTIRLTNMDLTGLSLPGERLPGINLSGSNLSSARLPGVNLDGAKLSNSILAGVDLTGADLTGADLTGADLTGATLAGADLTDATLIGARFDSATLTNATLTHADLAGANLICATLTNADLTHADLTGASLQRANLTNADLAHANLNGADLTDATLDETPPPGPHKEISEAEAAVEEAIRQRNALATDREDALAEKSVTEENLRQISASAKIYTRAAVLSASASALSLALSTLATPKLAITLMIIGILFVLSTLIYTKATVNLLTTKRSTTLNQLHRAQAMLDRISLKELDQWQPPSPTELERGAPGFIRGAG